MCVYLPQPLRGDSFSRTFMWSQGTELWLASLCRSHPASSNTEVAGQWRQSVIPELRKLRQEDDPVGLRLSHRDSVLTFSAPKRQRQEDHYSEFGLAT